MVWEIRRVVFSEYQKIRVPYITIYVAPAFYIINPAAVSVGKVPVSMRLSAGFGRPKLPPV